MDIATLTDDELGARIMQHQRVQRSQPNSWTDAWEAASRALEPLLVEAAKRTEAGSVIKSL